MAERKGKPKKEIRKLTREEWLASILGDIDPMKHAGEGWFQTDEYPTPEDVSDPFVAAEVGREGDYYPGMVQSGSEKEALLKLLRRTKQ
jgi:hypothetical protein